ncbi:RnfABCDGE type electron transport complex subunit G [Flammeovirga yaeyamensis]|uniref:Ion-translocating oxidoreductase complex subunit G n=1 Tax=Flammeovirga yaeyamensis TaxID=367791 RepID=A0AAX1NC11_9BACT|nr:RnfABCDGE type electron transport complex subunit G [Flammeovirga yaeyamensis]MBB3701372.1 electron transport complex protein RnfG [Flammeovirga yaeyamensis]NMF38560.1 RnfABCDGE type electron transport complex subunit G [Flammeovirga yaeyamensis]QWG04476.1 RnfABCDGE type electron transport complex subunit G [Flammeovirga yaeyamensis]
MNLPNQSIPQENSANSKKMLMAMVGIGAFCALLIVLIFEGTKERRAFLKAEALEKAIFQVIPNAKSMKPMQFIDGKLTEVDKDAKGETLYAGYDESNQLVGYAIEASGQGYADIIKILYGYDPQKQAIVGFQVLESKETPGLGDKIEKEEAFLANFISLDVTLNADKKALANEVVTVKQGEKTNPWEVDGITGATISSRAIGDIINSSMQEMGPKIGSK